MDGTINPARRSRVATRLAAMLTAIGAVLLLAAGPAGATPTFTDVGTGHWAYEAVEWSYARGIATGYPVTGGIEFRPLEESTRAQMIAFLWKAAGSPTGLPAHSMTNVPPWVENAVRWGVSENIIGPTGNFNPDNDAVRSTVVTWLWKYVDQPTGFASTSFSDVAGNASYKPAIDWAVASGVASGFPDGTFRPGDPLNRAQTVSWLYATYLPPTPTGLSVTNGGRTDALSATWTAPTGYTRFRVAVDGGTPVDVATTSHQFTGLLPETSHTVTVRTLGGGQAIGSTASANASTATRPAAPTNVQVTGRTSTSITVSWSGIDDANRNGWAVKVAPTGGTPEWIPGASWEEDEDARTHTVGGLDPATDYTLAVEAIGYLDRWANPAHHDSDDVTLNSSTTSGTTTDLTLTTPQTDRIVATWAPVSGVTTYKVAIDGGAPADVTGTSRTFSGLMPATSHTVTVRTVGAGGALGDTVSRTLTTRDRLSPPTNVQVTNVSSTSFTVTWDRDSDTNRNGWAVKRSTGSATPAWVSGWSWEENENAVTFTGTGLTSGTTYHLALEAIGYDDGRWPNSVEDSDDVTFDVPTAVSAAPAPTNVELTGHTTDSVTASWTRQSGYNNYTVSLDGATPVPVTGSSWTFHGLAIGSTHNVSVRTVGSAGQSSSSAVTDSGFTLARLLPPGDLEVTGKTSTTVSLRWTHDDDAHRNGFGIVRWNAATSTWDWHGQWIEDENATSVTVTNLSPGTSYRLGVQAIGSTSDPWPSGLYWSDEAYRDVSTTTGAACSGDAQLHTAQGTDGRWHVYDQANQIVRLNSVNIRLDDVNSPNWNAADIQSIRARGFNSIRVAMEWYRFENSDGTLTTNGRNTLDALFDAAEDADLYIILDPIHITNAGDKEDDHVTARPWAIPGFAWGQAGYQIHRNNIVEVVDEIGIPYIRTLLQRYCDSPAMGAIDVVNEPDSPEIANVSLDSHYGDLIPVYRSWITSIRQIDDDIPLMFEPFFGSTTISTSRLQELSNNRTNLIWSFHDYFTGWGDNQGANDGYGDNGHPDGVRTEDWMSGKDPDDGVYDPPSNLRRCYPRGGAYVTQSACNPAPDRAAARTGTTNHVNLHRNAANTAHMPVYVGEFNIPHAVANPNQDVRTHGWWGVNDFLCDKSQVYRSLGVGSAVWDWESNATNTYGMYTLHNGSNPGIWHQWAQLIAGPDAC
jgi:hypothetical protein